MHRLIRRSALAGAAILAVLAGCHGSDSDSQTSTPPPSSPPPVATDAFITTVKELIATAPEDTEPAGIEAVTATMPEDTEPIAVN